MNKKLKFLYPAAVLFFLLLPGRLAADTEISIYYTASLNGNLIGCDCKGVPKAGLSVTAAYLRDIDSKDSIILDLGDFNDARTDELLSDTLVNLYSELGYTVAAVGDQELGSGVDYFKKISKKLNFISDNLKVDGKYVNPEPFIIEKQGIKIGIASVIDPDVFFFYPEDVKNRVKAADPAEAAKDVFKKLEARGVDYSLLIYHGNLEAAKEIFRNQDEWDAVLAAHDQTLYEQIDGSRVLASPGEEGNRVARLSLTFRFGKLKTVDSSMRYFKYEEDPEDPEVVQAFEDYKKELIKNLRNGSN